MLHGWGETGAQYAGLAAGAFDREGADRWIEESERGCFFVVWPQGILTKLGSRARYKLTSWNAGGCSSASSDLCDVRAVVHAYGQQGLCSLDTCGGTCDACAWCTCLDDVDFIVSLTRELRASNLGIDAQRVYVAGCSNGGMMAYELMMRAPSGIFAAFVTNCGLPHVGHLCAPRQLRPILHLHDPNDRTIPPDGSPAHIGGWRYERADGVLASLGAAGGCALVDADRWLQLDGFGEASGGGIGMRGNGDGVSSSSGGDDGTEATELQWLRGVSFPGGRSFANAVEYDRCTLRAACDDGAELVYCTGDFGHDWPAWGAAVAWRFLRQYSTADADLATEHGRRNGSDNARIAQHGSERGREHGSARALPRCEMHEAAPLHGAEDDKVLALALLDESELLVASPSPAPEEGSRNQLMATDEGVGGDESGVCAQSSGDTSPPSPAHSLPGAAIWAPGGTAPTPPLLLSALVEGAALLACAALLALCCRGWRACSSSAGSSGSSSRSSASHEVELRAVAAPLGDHSAQAADYELNDAAAQAAAAALVTTSAVSSRQVNR